MRSLGLKMVKDGGKGPGKTENLSTSLTTKFIVHVNFELKQKINIGLTTPGAKLIKKIKSGSDKICK